MSKNKRNSMRKKKSFLVDFLMPTKWKILAAVLLYFSNLVSFFGLMFNFPIYYAFYWNRPSPTGLEGFAVLIIHIAYLYLLSCALIKLLSLD